MIFLRHKYIYKIIKNKMIIVGFSVTAVNIDVIISCFLHVSNVFVVHKIEILSYRFIGNDFSIKSQPRFYPQRVINSKSLHCILFACTLVQFNSTSKIKIFFKFSRSLPACSINFLQHIKRFFFFCSTVACF